MKKIEELEGLLEELPVDGRPVARRRIYTGQVAD